MCASDGGQAQSEDRRCEMHVDRFENSCRTKNLDAFIVSNEYQEVLERSIRLASCNGTCTVDPVSGRKFEVYCCEADNDNNALIERKWQN